MYSHRLRELHEQGRKRMAVFWSWRKEMQNSVAKRSMEVIEACEATIAYLEDEFANRKIDFATELYAVLVERDRATADAVLDDLVRAFPWTKDAVVANLRDGVIDYSGLKQVS
ncbi:hypothetical protein BU26DRAFT_520901, partial [Trematosphaeria pertusa]